MQFRIDNMTCGGCARSVTKTIQKVDPAAEVEVDLDTKLVEVRSSRDGGAFAAALVEAGFPPAAAA
jgi:copper chaperone